MRRMSDHEQAAGAIPPEPNASDKPHDVLAAEEFAIPGPEAVWRDRPVELPPEPDGSDEPHDVLAAEQFAMPAPPRHVAFASPPPAPRQPSRRHLTVAAAGLGAAFAALLHRRRRHRDRRS